ncbi:hypothetical protein ACFS5M_06510 [Lacinutrix iliipiscaria]|uniref:Sulfotransferase domain-containing protein n=1 Tax=Lacinutrix iliipiscaria TaxID=1230532 RepID=A0ABW5WLH6_9FLAO
MNKIHIGYPKTATTYLQKHIFPQLINHQFVGHPEFHKFGLMDIIYKPDRSIDFEKHKSHFKAKNNFISFEELTGPIFKGSFMIDVIPHRLAKIFDSDSKILITIRRQDSLIKSAYIQYIHQGGTMKLGPFIRHPKYGMNRIDLNTFDFLETYKVYSEVFGKENVSVIPYELLKTDDICFFEKLEDFFENEKFDIKKNTLEYRSLSGFQLSFLKNLNRFLKSPLSEKYIIPPRFINQDKLRRKLQASNILRFGSYFNAKDEALLKHTLTKYQEGNEILDKTLNLNLKEHGYY